MENLERRETGRSGVHPHRYVHPTNSALRAWVRMLRLSQKVQSALAETLRGLGLNPAEVNAELIDFLRPEFGEQ